MNEMEIRPVRISDAERIADIYAHYVATSSCTFDLESPTVEEMEVKIQQITQRLPWYCAVQDEEVVGFSYAALHRQKRAYQWSVESSIYLHPSTFGSGAATLLYERLLEDLRTQGILHCYAGITLPNDASIAFHRKMGFVPFATYKDIGFKQGRWRSVEWWHLQLGVLPDAPSDPTPWNLLRD